MKRNVEGHHIVKEVASTLTLNAVSK